MKVSDLSVGDEITLAAGLGTFPSGAKITIGIISRQASGQYRLTIRNSAALEWNSETFTLDGDDDV